MTRNVFFASLFGLSLSACIGNECDDCADQNGGNDIDDSELCGDCPDDTGDTNETGSDELGYLVVTASIRGTNEDAQVVINGDSVGATSAPIELEPGDYAFGLGDPENTDDGIPIHVSTSLPDTWANSSWITPFESASVESDVTVRVDGVVMNYYAIGANATWTCDGSGAPQTGELVYTDGYIVDMPGIGDIRIVDNGTILEHLNFPDLITGSFTGPTTAEVHNADDGETWFCWSGNENQDPRE